MKHLSKYYWAYLAALALFLCIDIEFEWILIHSCSTINGNAVNNIILALSYSYIAAAIFHYIVVFLPYKKKKKAITPFLKTELLLIREKLRLCKTTVLPFFCYRQEYTKDEFVKIFTNINLYENCFTNNGISKKERIEKLRLDIMELVGIILTFREYIDNDLFLLLNDLLNSIFIVNGLDPYPDVDENIRFEYNGNQPEIGTCIYDLYEQVNSFIIKESYETN